MTRRFDAAVMHDYYVDRLLHMDSFEGLAVAVAAKKAVGGGGSTGPARRTFEGGTPSTWPTPWRGWG